MYTSLHTWVESSKGNNYYIDLAPDSGTINYCTLTDGVVQTQKNAGVLSKETLKILADNVVKLMTNRMLVVVLHSQDSRKTKYEANEDGVKIVVSVKHYVAEWRCTERYRPTWAVRHCI